MTNGTRRGRGVSVTPQPLFTPRKDPVPIVQEAGWTPGPVWTCAENLTPTKIRSPDRPARSQSLYRLRYPAHTLYVISVISTCPVRRNPHTFPHQTSSAFCLFVFLRYQHFLKRCCHSFLLYIPPFKLATFYSCKKQTTGINSTLLWALP